MEKDSCDPMSTQSNCLHCQCFINVRDKLRECARENQQLRRSLKTAEGRVKRLKTQKQKLLTKKYIKKIRKTQPIGFFNKE